MRQMQPWIEEGQGSTEALSGRYGLLYMRGPRENAHEMQRFAVRCWICPRSDDIRGLGAQVTQRNFFSQHALYSVVHPSAA